MTSGTEEFNADVLVLIWSVLPVFFDLKNQSVKGEAMNRQLVALPLQGTANPSHKTRVNAPQFCVLPSF